MCKLSNAYIKCVVKVKVKGYKRVIKVIQSLPRGGWPRVIIHFTFLRSLLTVTIDTEKMGKVMATLALLSV